MAYLFKELNRRVIPNWRSFKNTLLLGELNPSKKITIPTEDISLIEEFIRDWYDNKTVAYAAELLSSAFVNGITQHSALEEAANFLIENNDKITREQNRLALSFQNRNEPIKKSVIDSLNLDERIELYDIDHARKKINRLKQLRNKFPLNPVIYVDIARIYASLGQSSKALDNLKIAVELAPENRFVLRTLVRHLVHVDDIDQAHDILRKKQITAIDPWLLSAEITLATLRDRYSRFMKKGNEIINSNNFNPLSITELASSIATIELISGNRKKSKVLFNQALISPNDNSLAQVEWAVNTDNILELNLNDFKEINNNFEANALNNYHEEKWLLAYNDSLKWFLDLPFSKRPVMFGSHIAATILDDHKKAIRLIKAGLVSNPNDSQLLNNIAYSLALENNPIEANNYLNKIPKNESLDKTTQICIAATKGLINFKQGNAEFGRKLYLKAIEDAKDINDSYYNWLAILNLAREEIAINSAQMDTLMEAVALIPKKSGHFNIDKLRVDIEEFYRKNKK